MVRKSRITRGEGMGCKILYQEGLNTKELGGRKMVKLRWRSRNDGVNGRYERRKRVEGRKWIEILWGVVRGEYGRVREKWEVETELGVRDTKEFSFLRPSGRSFILACMFYRDDLLQR